MKLNRRSALAGAAALSVSPSAFAQAFPNKPIKIIVPFAAGSATDLTARGLGARLQEILKQPIIVDDKPGASGQLGASAAATAPADGYTLLMGTNSTNAANAALFKKLSYDPEKDFAPIMRCVTGVNALVVNNGVGNWFPLRMNAPAEIVKLTLRTAVSIYVRKASSVF